MVPLLAVDSLSVRSFPFGSFTILLSLNKLLQPLSRAYGNMAANGASLLAGPTAFPSLIPQQRCRDEEWCGSQQCGSSGLRGCMPNLHW